MLESLQDLTDMLSMLFGCFGEDDYVIQVHDNESFLPDSERFQYAIHQSLECARCIAQSERKDIVFVQAFVGNECGLGAICFVHQHLVVTAAFDRWSSRSPM